MSEITTIHAPIAGEVRSEDPEPPEIIIDQMTLYHGSATSGIEKLSEAEEDTIGEGVYLVDNPQDASGYAKRRARRGEGLSPVVYEVKVENLKLVNLDNEQKLQEIMGGFAEELQRARASSSEKPWFAAAAIDKSLTAIQSGIEVGHVKDAVHSQPAMFSTYLKSLGYDGLKALEGGEGDDVGFHETYLIFDPQQSKIKSEQPIQ